MQNTIETHNLQRFVVRTLVRSLLQFVVKTLFVVRTLVRSLLRALALTN
ncbi:MAG: hypothetical protein MUE44_21770 [Oscillatoriaceae cyanobacterium Prado104]|nr:hypothetical protein [Oscillatoriaceae cyanobacterium Prado104]